MPGRLTGKVALITGAASGIGAATSKLFIAEGALVLAADIKEVTDVALARELTNGTNAKFKIVDVTSESDVSAAIADATKYWGRLDISVACAGITGGQGADTETSERDWDAVMAINAKGVFFVTKYAAQQMRKQRSGSIINIASAYSIVGAAGNAAYCASKGAVRLLTKATAIEHAAEGIRANAVHPGVVDTPMMRAFLDRSENPEAMLKAIMSQHPNNKICSAEDIAWACVYLASDESRMVTGTDLIIDGGMTAR